MYTRPRGQTEKLLSVWTTAQREGAQCSALAGGSWRQSARHGAGADHTHGYPHLKSGLTQHVLEKNG